MKIGILGAGQLGKMLAEAGQPLGHEFRFLDPTEVISARGLGEHHRADYTDQEALARFAEGLDLVTYEFENVPVTSARFLAERLPVYPPPVALEKAQDRIVEKTFACEHGLVPPDFCPVASEEGLRAAMDHLGVPFVLKTCRMGYDGKGQAVVREHRYEAALAAWEAIGRGRCIAEEMIRFDRELSLLSVRGRDGQLAFYPLVENTHEDGILRLSVAPAPKTILLQPKAERMARNLLEAMDYVGVLAIEFFDCGGELLINEMAPRVHNSGHWSIEGAECSQFENHIRAITGAELGSTALPAPSRMINIIGDWSGAEPYRNDPKATIHDYGKEPRPGRKIGHVTLLG